MTSQAAPSGGARVPRMRDVLVAQLHATRFALRVPIVITVVSAVLGTVVLGLQVASGHLEKNLLAQPSSLPGIVGALLPVAIWAREERFGPGYMWTLPVDRSRHALLRVLAGWLWLIAGLILYSLCILALAFIAGESVPPVETMHLLTAPYSRSVPVDPATLRIARWAPGPIVWLIPFASATAMYLLASAAMLGIRHPLRWLIAVAVGLPVVRIAGDFLRHLLGTEWLANAPASVVDGRYGLEALLTLRTWSLDRRVMLTTGETLHAWSGVPDLGAWGIAALLWTAAGAIALWAAASRHRERRRA